MRCHLLTSPHLSFGAILTFRFCDVRFHIQWFCPVNPFDIICLTFQLQAIRDLIWWTWIFVIFINQSIALHSISEWFMDSEWMAIDNVDWPARLQSERLHFKLKLFNFSAIAIAALMSCRRYRSNCVWEKHLPETNNSKWPACITTFICGWS